MEAETPSDRGGEVPEETVRLQVEVGLNGCTGTLWIDEVRAEREQ